MPQRPSRRIVAIAAIALGVAACQSDRGERANPLAPTPPGASRAVDQPMATGAGPAGAERLAPGARGAPVPVPAEGAFDVASLIHFPPRNESFAFRQELERKYRDGLHRSATSTYADVEGDVVWTQEYLRYRANGCEHLDAVHRVFQQIDGGPGAPVCSEVSAPLVAFPPRDQSYAFRQDLEIKYRDGLGRTATPTFVDLEGSIVWTQEYLRYRVNACSHATSVARVFQQIDGGPIGPVCVTIPGDPITGHWTGTSDYPNAPFTMDLNLSGRRVSGWWQDQKDRGSVDAEYQEGHDIRFHIYFGDTGFFMDGRFEGPDLIRGSFRVPVLGNRRFEFEMTR